MKAAIQLIQAERMASELATLSCDPALTFRPDPAFRAKFRNPDEIVESDLPSMDTGTRTLSATPLCWANAVSWRRSPKE